MVDGALFPPTTIRRLSALKLSIIAVGTKMPAWVQQGYDEYARRMPKELTPQLIEQPLGVRSKSISVEKVKEAEGVNMLSAIGQNNHVVALDVLGKTISTEGVAKKLENWQMDGVNVSILIGGPDGLAKDCLQRANEKWSLSGLTLPHPLVRIVLIEQLYRGWTILQNHPYHK